jgi:hypothetical protein
MIASSSTFPEFMSARDRHIAGGALNILARRPLFFRD